jgi:hypothetical protein
MSTKLVISGPYRVLAIVYTEDSKQVEVVKNVLDNTTITLKVVDTHEVNTKEVKTNFTYSNETYNKIGIIMKDKTLVLMYDREENKLIRSGKEADARGNTFKRDLAFNVPEEVHLLFNTISDFIKTSVTKYMTSINIKTKCNRISTTTYSTSTENSEKKFILKGIVNQYSEFFCMCDGKLKPLSIKNDKVFTSLLKAKSEFSKNLFVFNSIFILLKFNTISCVANLMSSIIKPYVKTYSKTSFMDTIEFTEEEKKNFNVDESVVNNLNNFPQELTGTEKTSTKESEMSTQDLLDALDENN